MKKKSSSSLNENPLDAEFRLDGVDACRESSTNLLQRAQRTVEIFSYDLDPRLYDRQPFLSGAKDFCLHSRFSRLRILLQNNEKVQTQGHRLLDLVRRLPSIAEIRRPHPDHIDRRENFLLVDNRLYIRWNLDSRYQGFTSTGNRLRAQHLSELFTEIWQCSEPDSNLRRLYI